MVGALFGPTVTTEALLAATGDGAWLRAMLDAEAALAGAEAQAGVIPAAAAGAIRDACATGAFSAGDLGRDARAGGNPVIPLVRALRAAVGDAHATWVHWGATSQDILDTAAALVAHRATGLIVSYLDDLSEACADLAERHRGTLMVGRTLLQPALPITFGLKAAGWLDAVEDATDGLTAARSHLAAQLGGAAGTLASLGAAGPDVAARFAADLGLSTPALPWHTARQRTASLAGTLGVVAGTSAKISGDIGLLAQAEVAEAREPSAPGRGGSSTLPHKRNPVGAAAVAAATRRALALVPVLQSGLLAEHERALGAWQAEWEPLGDLLALAGGAAARTAETVAGLEVDTGAMAANLAATGGVLLGERVVLELGRRGHREEARTAVDEAARDPEGFAAGLSSRLVPDLITAEELDDLLDPAAYLGSTTTWIDRALARHRHRRTEPT